MEVWYGTNHLNRPGVIRANIEKIIPHELYYAYSSNYDIALLKLESEIVEYSKKVQPVILPTSDFTNKTVKAVVSGWDRPGVRSTLIVQIQGKLILLTIFACRFTV